MSENTGDFEFTRQNIDNYLKEVAKVYRKLIGKSMPAEMILIGGASVLINYGFRNMTTDIDAIIQAASCMKDAINHVGNQHDLPPGWLNTDFTKTSSYSDKLSEFSQYYHTFSNVLEVRTISAEYLIAMKLKAGRPYKNDFSDILGILAEEQKGGHSISLREIENAVLNLYGNWESLPSQSRDFIQKVMDNGNFAQLFRETQAREKENLSALVDFTQDYPDVLDESNLEDILNRLKEE